MWKVANPVILSAIHIARILKVSRTWLFTNKKQFPEGAPNDFNDPGEMLGRRNKPVDADGNPQTQRGPKARPEFS
jgi:hypothetical protein